MNQIIQQFMQNMDEEQARGLLEQMDEQQIAQAIQWFTQEMILPHLEDIRTRAHNDPPTEEVRAHFESMSQEEREEEFYETLDELVAILVRCREHPAEGFKELKTMLRDPFTAEALLLIFENEDHIDPEYSAQMKDFGITHMKWVGAMVLPEMYDDHEVQEVLDQLNMDADGFDENSQQR